MNLRKIEIYGHTEPFNVLLNAYNNKFPQSWIFNGEEGLGKSLIARKFVLWSLARDSYDSKLIEFESLSQDRRDHINSRFRACVLEVNTNKDKMDDINFVHKSEKNNNASGT